MELATPVLPALLVACTPDDGDDTAADGDESPVTTMTTGATAGDSSGPAPTTEPATTDEPTTADPSTTTTTTTTSTSTTDEPTTDPTTDTTGGDETGPICDPGMPGCVCDGGDCVDGYVCINDVCAEGLDCPADIEPAVDSEDTPVELGDISDDDDDFFDQSGVLSGASDVDWYRLHGADTFGHVAEPTAMILSGQQRNCLFLQCDEGGVALTKVTCPAGTDFAISPKLRPGCCGSASFTIKEINCPGQDESLQMWLRVDKPAADVCSDYNVKLHF